MKRNKRPVAPASVGSLRSVNYSTSPLLASRTPPWRSKLLVALVGAGFLRADRASALCAEHRHRLLPQAG